MCKVHNPVGSLTTIKQQLKRHKIDGFHSVQELLDFQDSYPIARQQILSKREAELAEHKNKLSNGVLQLENEVASEKIETEQKLRSEIESLRQEFDQIPGIEKSYLQEFTYSFKALFLLMRIMYKEYFFKAIVAAAAKDKNKVLAVMKERLQILESNFDKEVSRSISSSLHDLDNKKKVIDEIKSTILGALGEQKVAHELEQLGDEYILINDFSYRFKKSIYYKQQNQYIKTIQADHLLVSPSGIFLIETKNWSKDSIKNLNLRSPVEQIKRTNYALYRILSGNEKLGLNKHHWGDRKIPIRNLIVMVNHKPPEEFEYVKVLTLNELLGYVEYFKPTLSQQETQEIADYFLSDSTPNFDVYSNALG